MIATSIRPSSSVRPIRRHRLPRVARHASPRVSRLPIAAAAVTWAIIPVTRIRPIDCRMLPSPSEPKAPMRPATSAPDMSSPDWSRDRSTVQVSSAVTRTGIAMATAATRTADPTVALGLKRMMRNAASYMSPMPSGRSGRAPGLVGRAEHPRHRARGRRPAGGRRRPARRGRPPTRRGRCPPGRRGLPTRRGGRPRRRVPLAARHQIPLTTHFGAAILSERGAPARRRHSLARCRSCGSSSPSS